MAEEGSGFPATWVVVAVVVEDEEDDDEERLGFEFRFVFLRLPPPIGMLRRAPPLVQYLRQFLQKWRG